MAVNIQAVFGISSALINLVAFIPYISSIINYKTKPERSSWWIWSILMIISLIAQISGGATWSVLLTVVFLVSDLLVAILSIKYGYGRFNLKDWIAVIASFIGVGLWVVTDNPLTTLIIVIAVDAMANWLTVIKSWRAPYSEKLISWVLGLIAAILSVASITTLTITVLIFPLYVVLAGIIDVFVITYRRQWRSKRIREGIKSSKYVY